MPASRVFLAAIVGTSLWAQPPTGVVQGTLRDSVTGAGIAGAYVRLMGAKTIQATTAADGSYRMDQVQAGSYRLNAYLTGYVNQGLGPTIAVSFSSGIFQADTTLDPLAVVRGKVTDAEGKPADGVQVSVRTNSLSPTGGGSAKTDENGVYVIQRVQPADATICVDPNYKPKTAPQPDEARMEPVATCYPSEPAGDQNRAVRLQFGDRNSGLDVRLLAERVHRVRGSVRSASGEPKGGVAVAVMSARSRAMRAAPASQLLTLPSSVAQVYRTPVATTQTDRNGNFEFPSLREGSWSMLAYRPADLASQKTETGPNMIATPPVEALFEPFIVANRDIDDLALRMLPPAIVTVVWDGETRGEPTLSLVLSGIGAPATMMLAGHRPSDGPSQVSVTPGPYAVTAQGLARDQYIASITVGGQEALGREVALTSFTQVRVTYGSQPATVRGVVERGQGALVLLYPPAGSELEPVLYAPATDGGSFAFPGLRPATYSVVAIRDVDPSTLSDGVLRALLNRATSVRLEKGATESVNLTLQTP